MIWILKKLKTVSTEIVSLGNKCVNYLNDLRYFVTTRQGPLEGDYGYIKRVISPIETLILSEGHHVLCSPDIMGSVDQANPLEKETTTEEEKFRAIHLL